MSIEQKIAEVLEKSRLNQNTLNEEVEQDDPDLDEGESDEDMDEVLDILENSQLDELSKKTLGSYITKNKLTNEALDSDATINSVTAADNAKIKRALARQEKSKLTPPGFEQNPDNARNNVDNEDEAANAVSKKPNRVTNGASAQEAMKKLNREEYDVSADVDALLNGEDLTEDFKVKAATIFEAAIISRVKTEVERLEEEFIVMIEEAITENQKGLVERVDGYLDYIVEQWIAQNEIALERGMKSEILEGFVSGLKGLFEEHYIDIPEEKFDVLNSLEEEVSDLEEKLNIQISTNIDLNKSINEMKRVKIVKEVSDGLPDTDAEKFMDLTEELSFEDEETFTSKVKTIRENYFSTKSKANVKSVVTDNPVDVLTEEKRLDPKMASYLTVLNRK